MGNFFCKMHLLINFATEANNMLCEFEHIACSNQSPNSIRQNESEAARLIRTACKAFHPCGSDKAGVASHFLAFLTWKKIPPNFVVVVVGKCKCFILQCSSHIFPT